MDGRSQRHHCLGGEVSPSFLLSLLEWLALGLLQLAVGKEGLVGELLLVLFLDPVVGFVEPHHIL